MATHSSILAWRIPMGRGVWWAAVQGVAKSWTRLKRISTHALVNKCVSRRLLNASRCARSCAGIVRVCAITCSQHSCKAGTVFVTFTDERIKAQRYVVACQGLHSYPVTTLRCKSGMSDSEQSLLTVLAPGFPDQPGYMGWGTPPHSPDLGRRTLRSEEKSMLFKVTELIIKTQSP